MIVIYLRLRVRLNRNHQNTSTSRRCLSKVLAINNTDLQVINLTQPRSLCSIYDLKYVNTRYEDNWTQIMYAAYTGEIQHVQELIKHKARSEFETTKRSHSPHASMHLANLFERCGFTFKKSKANIHMRSKRQIPCIYALLTRNKELLDLFYQVDSNIYNYEYFNAGLNLHEIEKILNIQPRTLDNLLIARFIYKRSMV